MVLVYQKLHIISYVLKKKPKQTTRPKQTTVTTQNNNFHPGHLLLTLLRNLEMCTPKNANTYAILPVKSKIHTNFI